MMKNKLFLIFIILKFLLKIVAKNLRNKINKKLNLGNFIIYNIKYKIIFRNHILITGSLPPGDGLFFLIRPLRSKQLSKILDIVILNPNYPDDQCLDQLSIFPNIYFIIVSNNNNNIKVYN
jgi:hypothetical protein